ncbi:MAG: hypothetical protein KAS38_01455, partial [Anaerolineales bacterium]|nr:hypothetical protein [Anaerolineales bacterium]
MSDSSVFETVIKHDRLIVIGGLVAVMVLSWIYILAGTGMSMTAFEMTALTKNAQTMMMQPAVWTSTYALIMFFMWWVM